MHNDNVNVSQVVALQFHELMPGSGGQVTYALQRTHCVTCLDAFVTSNQLCHDCDQAVVASLDSSNCLQKCRSAKCAWKLAFPQTYIGRKSSAWFNAASVLCHAQT